MENIRTIQVKREILASNTAEAEFFRKKRQSEHTFMMDIMGSPGAGKTTLLLALIETLRAKDALDIGVIEADLESDVDARKIKEAGIESVELNTRGICHVEMNMVQKAYDAFGGKTFDYMFLENIGNLVCPAEFDTGCHARIMLLSVPEGYDKVYKYPPMFAVVDALVVTKIDYLPLNPDFELESLREAARALNPHLKIFEVSARTGEGIEAFASWVQQTRISALKQCAPENNNR